ncbi:MAG: class I SAM-dependent methyltransferase [Dehalococcoidia bacterium]
MDSTYFYDETIAARYDAQVPLGAGEVEFYTELAREAAASGLRTLEVTCGTGRVTIPMARAGIRMVGLDVSPAMLARARANSVGLDIEWVEGDIRSFDLGEQFGLVTIPVGSFQLLTEVDDQLDSLRCIHRHLAPGGRLAFEVENPNLVGIADWLTTKRGALVRNPARDYQHPDTGLNVRSWDTVQMHTSVQCRVGIRILDELDAGGRVVNRSYGRPMTVRYFHRYEMEHLLARAGFEVEALYGDTLKNEYRGASPDLIWVARPKP